MIIKMASYGLKSSGAIFCAKFAKVIYELEYRPSLADHPMLKIGRSKILVLYNTHVMSVVVCVLGGD